MQENNFEKQVQQKTSELKLKPSDEVWQKVAGTIAKGKNDRRVFALVFLTLLLIAPVIFIVWDHSSAKKINTEISAQTDLVKTNGTNKRAPDSNAARIAAGIKSPETISENLTTGNTVVADNPQKTGARHRQRQAAFSFPVKAIHPDTKNKTGNYTTGNLKNAGREFHSDKKGLRISGKEKLNVTINGSDAADETVSGDAQETKAFEANPILKNAAINERLAGAASNGVVAHLDKTDTVAAAIKTGISAKKTMQSKRGKKWKSGLNLSFGAASMQNSYFGITGSENKDWTNQYSSVGQSNGNPGQGASPVIPSKIKTGAGLVAGIYVRRDISPKINFLIGLNYKFYSSSMRIGSRTDTSNSNLISTDYFFRSGNAGSYKNKFHFIELPVAISYKLNKQRKLPVYLNIGISVSRLIAVNALQFEPLPGYYYKDDGLFNKTQVTVSSGLLFALSQSTNSLLIGPDINVNLNKMAGSGLYQNRRYSYFGLLLQKNIGKK